MASDLNSIRKKVAGMSKTALHMWELTYEAFMEHDTDLITAALDEEEKINELERNISAELVMLGRVATVISEKSKVRTWLEIVGDLELIGDYCKDTLERIELKIKEKLLFSDEAVKEYGHLYNKTGEALGAVVEALDRDNPALISKVAKEKAHFKDLLEQCRRHHEERMIEGTCMPFACNMYLNMLDFTGQIFDKSIEIASNIQRLR